MSIFSTIASLVWAFLGDRAELAGQFNFGRTAHSVGVALPRARRGRIHCVEIYDPREETTFTDMARIP